MNHHTTDPIARATDVAERAAEQVLKNAGVYDKSTFNRAAKIFSEVFQQTLREMQPVNPEQKETLCISAS